MKILLLNQHFHPEVASSGQIMTELCADLVKEGHEVTALTGRPSYRMRKELEAAGPVSPPRYRREWRSAVGPILGVLGTFLPRRILDLDEAYGINIVRTYTYTPKLRQDRWRFIQRMTQYLTFFISSFVAALFLPRHDVVLYLSTPPLLNGITGYALKLIKGTANIYNIQDLYPDIAVKLGAVKNKLVIKLCNVLAQFLYSNAVSIIPVGERIAQELIEKKVAPEKIYVIPNWMDTDLIKPLGKNTPFSRQHALTDKFVVMYSGNMGLSQGLDVVLKCAEITRDIDIHYVLIGGGASRDALVSMAEDLSLSKVRFLPYQPKARLAESLSAADVHLLPLKKGLSSYSVPSKIFGIMASGRPIVATVDADSEIAIMVKKARCGVVVEPANPQALAEVILSLYNNKDKLEILGKNGRDYLEKTVTRQICTGRYREVIGKAVS